MRISRLFPFLRRGALFFPASPAINLRHRCYCSHKYLSGTRWISRSTLLSYRKIDTQGPSDNDFEGEIDLEPYDIGIISVTNYTRDLMYKQTSDVLLKRIYNCVSIQDLFNVLDCNGNDYKCEHLAQTVMVLYDFKRIFQNVNGPVKASEMFLEKLKETETFHQLLKRIEEKVNGFDSNTMSFVLLFLNKLGLEIEHPLLQLLSSNLEAKLLENFSITYAYRYLETVFWDPQIKSYYMSINLIPLVMKEIDVCSGVEQLQDLTLSLNKLNRIVTEETLEKYKCKVEEFIQKDRLSYDEYKTILTIISFLNYPKWRDKNATLISRCILLMKDNLNLLDVYELIMLYDVLFKINQPGEILSELQRCASRYLQQCDDTISWEKISLFSSLIFFTPTSQRFKFQKTITDYVKDCNNIQNLLLLRRSLAYVKIANLELPTLYWDKILKILQNNPEEVDILKLCHNYIHFNIDIDNYRHRKFEDELLRRLKSLAMDDFHYKYFPNKLASILSFALLYSEDNTFLEYLVSNLETNWQQLGHIDCLQLSITLRMFKGLEKKMQKLPFANRTNRIVNRIIENELNNHTENIASKNGAFTKSCIFKSSVSEQTLNRLLLSFKRLPYMSSKIIENLVYCFISTNTLVPEVLEMMSDYTIQYKGHLMGFNVGKMLYLFYTLGYRPKNADAFFETAIDTIIRDQERLSGLTILHAALALCFFNKLPNSLIKSIFNVEFLDKLDKELRNCYSKDKYPQRVRSNMMQLNRAVSLDYPESNVPWFHKKYIEDLLKTGNRHLNKAFPMRVKDYLAQVIHNKSSLLEYVITPYGYVVDFVVDSLDTKEKLAVLLVPQYAYTKNLIQLQGKHQLRKRHLEMLGYKVILINFSDWISLYYADERKDFLCNLITST